MAVRSRSSAKTKNGEYKVSELLPHRLDNSIRSADIQTMTFLKQKLSTISKWVSNIKRFELSPTTTRDGHAGRNYLFTSALSEKLVSKHRNRIIYITRNLY